MVRLIAIVLLAALWWPLRAQVTLAERMEDLPDVYSDGFRIEATDWSTTGVTLRITNDQPEITLEPRHLHRIAAAAFIAVPPGATGVPTVLEARFDFIPPDGGAIERDLDLDQERQRLAVPSQLAAPRLSPIDEFRSVGVLRLDMPMATQAGETIMRPSGGERGVALLREVLLDIAFVGGSTEDTPGPAPELLPEVDPFLIEMAPVLFANAAQVPYVSRDLTLTANDDVMRWNGLLENASGEGPLIQLRVPRPGIYSVDRALLRAAGVEVERLDVGKLRAFLGGEEVPLGVRGPSTGPPTEDTRLIVVVPEVGFGRVPYRTVWLLSAGYPGTVRQAVIPVFGSVPPQGTRAPLRRRVRVDDPRVFNVYYGTTSPNLKWAHDTVPMDSYREYPIDLANATPGSAAVVRVWFGGRVGLAHRFRAYWNGVEIGAQEWRTNDGPLVEMTVPAEAVRPGANTLAIEYPKPEANESDHLPVMAIEAEFEAWDAPLVGDAFFTADAPEGSFIQLSAERDLSRDGIFAHIDSSGKVATIGLGVLRRAAKGKFALLAQAPPDATYSMVVALSDQELMPEVQVVPLPASFLSRAPADYLAITWAGYRQELSRLLEYRESQGIRTRMLDVEDIYNAFSFGEKSYEAIHAAIRHRFEAADGRRLRSVLLVGEGSEYWWERRRETPLDVVEDQVPVFGWANPKIVVRGDDSYALLRGTGAMADIEIGRLSVGTASELATVIDKIVDYETRLPAGEWLTRHVFVTDDEPEFARVTNQVIRSELIGAERAERLFLQDFPTEEYFRIRGRRKSSVMTDRIIEEFDRGASTITYFGHGGPNLWSSERIFHLRDIERINHGGRQSILVAGSCDTAWVDYPQGPPGASLGERLLRKRDSGCAALWAPIAGTSSFEHRFLVGRFFRGLLRHGMPTVGSVSIYSKLGYLKHRSNASVPNQFILLGDPAMRLARAETPLEATISRDLFSALEQGQIEVTGTVPGVDFGQARIDWLDEYRYPVVETAVARVVEGRFAATLAKPGYLEPGKYTVAITASNEAERVVRVWSAPVTVQAPNIVLNWKADPPVGEGLPSGSTVRATLRIENREPQETTGVELLIRESSVVGNIARLPLKMAPGEVIERTVPLTVPEGTSRISARVVPSPYVEQVDPPPVAESSLELRARRTGGPFLAVAGEGLTPVRYPDREGEVSLRVPLTNLGRTDLVNAQLTLNMMDSLKGTPVGQSIVLTSLKAGETTAVEFRTSDTLPFGAIVFRLDCVPVQGISGHSQALLLPGLILPGRDLAIVDGTVRTAREGYTAGTTVFIEGTLRNNGPLPVRDVVFRTVEEVEEGPPIELPKDAYRVAQWDPRPLVPGESRPFRLRWDASGTRPRRVPLRIEVSAADSQRDMTPEDNEATIDVEFIELPNLSVQQDGVRQSQRYAMDGDIVTVTVPFANTSSQLFARPFGVLAQAMGADVAPETVFRQEFPRMEPGSSASVSISWEVEPGRNRLQVQVNDDRDYGEGTGDDNITDVFVERMVTPSQLGGDSVDWDFRSEFARGRREALASSPDGHLRLASERLWGFGQWMPFRAEWVRGRPLPEDSPATARDNRFSMGKWGHLVATRHETAGRVRMRIPMQADTGTTAYFVAIEQMGATRQSRVNPASLRVRVEGEKTWRTYETPKSGLIDLELIETGDNFLDIEVEGLANSGDLRLTRLLVTPARARFVSPVIVTRNPDQRKGRLIGPSIPPGLVRFEVRYGRGDQNEIEWTDWAKVADDGKLPRAPRGAGFLQWQVAFFGKPGDVVIENVRFERPPTVLGMVNRP